MSASSRHIKIFDTTLRDGEQSPGCSMNQKEKVAVAQQLERLNVDIIEAGFAIASPGDFASIQAIAQAVKTPIICSLARAKKADIQAAADSLALAKRKRIHTFIATSPVHMQYKLMMTPDQVVDTAVEAVRLAKSFVADVEFSCEDAGRSDWDFLVRVVTAAIQAGATTINIPDTVGYQLPDGDRGFGALIAYLMDRVPGIDAVDLSVHCHDDLGLATANALAGVRAGASQIECTINGIGERAGNTPLEEIVMALQVRSDDLGVHTSIHTPEIMAASRLVMRITGSVVQPNKAIVGANAFAHEAGIHQHGMLKNRDTYEIMTAESVGRVDSTLVLGKHSGRHAFIDKLKALNIQASDADITRAFERFKRVCDVKKQLTDRDIEALVMDEQDQGATALVLNTVAVVTGNGPKPSATVSLFQEDRELAGTETGEGSVDAIYNTVDALVGETFDLVDYVIHSVTGGTDAIAEVTVRLQENGQIFVGRGAALDVLVASAKAYINAINQLRDKRDRA